MHLLVGRRHVVRYARHHALHVSDSAKRHNVRDERNGEDAHVQMATRDHLVDSAHAGRVAANDSQDVAFCRRLVAGTRLSPVNAFLQARLKLRLLSNLVEDVT